MGLNRIYRNTCGFLFLLAASIAPGNAVRTTGNPTTVAEQFLLAAANQDRASLGLGQLHFDPVLAQAALYHANEMATRDEISHQFPGEPDLAERAASAGAHFSVISENVAAASSSSIIHDLWMHSPGHRANLLDPAVDAVGIAVVVRDHQFYAVEDFADTVESLSFDQQESSVASLLTKTGLQVVNGAPAAGNKTGSVEDARQTCSMSSGYAGEQRPWFIMRFTADKLNRLPDELESSISTGNYHQALVGACADTDSGSFTGYNIAVLLYP